MIKNKEWLKEQLKFEGVDARYATNNFYPEEQLVASEHVFFLIDNLDEKEKVVVPHFVADWFEERKEYLESAIRGLVLDSHAGGKSEIKDWFRFSRNKSVETLIKMKGGYTIEEEKRYRLSLKNNLALKVLICWEIKEEKWKPYENETFVGDWNKKAIFTESELSKIDETSFVRIEL